MKCNCSCVFDWTGLDYKWIPQLLRFHRDIKHTCYMMPACSKTMLRNALRKIEYGFHIQNIRCDG